MIKSPQNPGSSRNRNRKLNHSLVRSKGCSDMAYTYNSDSNNKSHAILKIPL